ncbi:C1 family peptidase [Litoreibacter arenae]|uniref:Peptidase C1A papain C-terminal domain-containing protein n=1 Tax=Litoreibacter arenae DSM 19593 TaxID=1123360 RepID=S9QB29_9RHOB|nr:C1 family peptidase [Litoreibacter arenae]EPX77152.1 hypothetical protein thalar_02873 [Litoreibacter arenae DSM 19593]
MNFEKSIKETSVRADWIDLRDQHYIPNLSVLRDAASLDPKLIPLDAKTNLHTLRYGVRNQGSSGRCVGFALANLIDIQRNLQWLRRPENASAALPDDNKPFLPDIVSADMLYRMAFFHDRYPDLEDETTQSIEGVRTLRSAIKGFYHHGVCMDWPFAEGTIDQDRWQSSCFNELSLDGARLFPTVDQAKSARNVGLGAYFRLASVLNHFHTALNDAEAVLTTANIHDGWADPNPDQGGFITWPPKQGISGTHAFVLTGYDENGFHVLNSWGPEWGGYKKQAGIALWSYADWAQNVVDSWVLRLAVYAPSAFGASIGEKGIKGIHGKIQSGSTPCSELVGHYMHLDDGFQVSTGSYPSFSDGWSHTRRYLEKQFDPKASAEEKAKSYKGVLVWIPGSLEGTKSAFDAAVQRKNIIKGLDLYPYSIFWCNNFVEKSIEVLQGLFDSCEAQAGSDAAHLDDLIESRVRGVGRAFWRDIEMGARRAVRGSGELPYEPAELDKLERIKQGFAKLCILDLIKLRHETGCEVHIVAEGAGALMVHEILSALDEDSEANDRAHSEHANWRKHAIFDTLHLVHPAIGMPRAEKLLIPFIDAMNGPVKGTKRRKKSSAKARVRSVLKAESDPRARIYIPEQDLEDRIHFGSYGKSIIHLVSRAFEDRYVASSNSKDNDVPIFSDARPFLGMAKIAEDADFSARGALFQLNDISSPTRDHDRISQVELNTDQTITNDIFEAIQRYRTAKK